MLSLSRFENESLMIGDEISVLVVRIQPGIRGGKPNVRLGIQAPSDVAVHRKEVWEQIRRSEGINRSLAGGARCELSDGAARDKKSDSWWYAVRVRDGACCVVWRYVDAAGELRVACARTGRPVSDADFNFLGPVDWPVGEQAIQ